MGGHFQSLPMTCTLLYPARDMDPLTHTLLGAGIGYAVFRQKLGRAAALAGGLAAFVPDADVFIRSANDPLVAIEYHRHFTHALPFAPVGAAAVACLWCGRAGWRTRWLWIWLCCLAAYVSHCLLDAATSYGTQLLWPFTRHRFGWDLISIIDPVFTLTLAVGLVWSLKVQRIRPVQVALVLAAGYVTLGGVQHARAMAAQQRLASSRGHTIERREVMPTLANNLVWRALYLHQGRIHSDRIRVGWSTRPTVLEGWSLPRVTAAELTESEQSRDRARNSFERFNWFSEGWVARKPADPWVLGDMRYSLSTEAFDPIWGIRYTEPGAAADIAWVNRSRGRRINFREFWDEVSGGDARFRSSP